MLFGAKSSTRKMLSINFSILLQFCQFTLMLSLLMPLFLTHKATAANNVQNFYFEDFTADYYLSKDEEGHSKLKVVENFTAVFPDYRQNKGLCRVIPFTNDGGRNITLEHLSKSDIVVKRNGLSEPIYSIEKISSFESNNNEGAYEVCTGTEEYVLGKQVYTFEYTFINVVTSFNQNGKSWQELYWDTNGNGFSQRFDGLTARLHFDDMSIWTGDAWCYVGQYGSHNQSRCKITKTKDGVEFTTTKLKSGENLTFDVELKDDSFVRPPVRENHVVSILAGILSVGGTLLTGFSIKKFLSVKDKRKIYKDCLVVPQYEPIKDYDLHVQAENYIGMTGNPSVATIIDMIVKGKIELTKGEKKVFGGNKWNINIKSYESLNRNEQLVLEILNGGKSVHSGDTIELKRHYSTSHLESLSRELSKHGAKYAKVNGLYEKDKQTINVGGQIIGFLALTFAFTFLPPILMVIGAIMQQDEIYYNGEKIMNFKPGIIIIIVAVVATMILSAIFRNNANKYINHTEKGLKESRYLDGLKLYIKMAEKERLEFLQSVKGADTSPEGIVKLYEKLLPYAVLFKVEKSWLKDMSKYCETYNISTSSMNLNVTDIAMMSSFINSVPATTNFSNSYGSSSSSSSHSSGGGGGGFSGGGGGGGGGGGR